MEENLVGRSYMGHDWSNQLKGLAILLVMIGHLRLIRFSAAWGVAIFLLVSGFGLTQSYLKNGLDGFFKKRISKILIPYSFVTLLWVLIDTFVLDSKNSLSVTALALLGVNIQCVFDLSMWYVTFILAWYMAFYLAFRFFKQDLVRMISLFLFAMVLYKISNIFPAPLGVPRYVIEFPVGVLLGISYQRISKIPLNNLLNMQSFITVTCFVLFYYLYQIPPTIRIELLECLFCGVSITSFFSVLSIYSVKLKFIEYVGSISYELYLFEYVFIEKYRFIFELNLNPWLRLAIYFLVVFSLAISLKFLIAATKDLLNRKDKNALVVAQ